MMASRRSSSISRTIRASRTISAAHRRTRSSGRSSKSAAARGRAPAGCPPPSATRPSPAVPTPPASAASCSDSGDGGQDRGKPMSALDRSIRDLVIANRILAHQGVLDAFGHVSVRHPEEQGRYLLARSCSPGMVAPSDIVEFWLDGRPVGEESRPLYMERFIHGAAYETMPEVNAVLHAHAE